MAVSRPKQHLSARQIQSRPGQPSMPGPTRTEIAQIPSAKLTVGELNRLDNYITTNIAQTILVTELAAEIGLSKSYFSRIFQMTTQHSVHQYILRCRLQKAVHLIQTSQLKLIAIAAQTGFSDQSHLSRVCKRYLGVTPKSLLAKPWYS